MAIKVTTAAEVIRVETLCMTLYAQPGLGKTTLSFTASRPLLLDFDKGAYRASNRQDVVQVEKWSDVAGITAEDVEDYDTIILDTVGKALEFLTQDILSGSPKLGYGGALNQQGWGQLGVRFRAFLSKIQKMGKDVILISHMDEKSDGDQIKERLKIPGGSKDLVLTDSDVIGRIVIHNRQRRLVFSPTETAFGKDPAQLGDMEIPNDQAAEFSTFLGDTLEQVKTALNGLSAAQVERRSEVEWFTQHLPDVKDADGINALLGRAKKAGNDIAKMVVSRAQELGLEFDPDAREYVYLEDTMPAEEDGEAA